MSADDGPGTPRADGALQRGRLARIIKHRRTWPIVGVSAFVLAAGLSVLGVINVPGASAASAAIAVAVIAVGLLLWLPSGENKGSRSELGAAVLGGAVVAFALLFFEGQRQQAADRLAARQNFQIALAAQPDLGKVSLTHADLRKIVLVKKRLSGADLSSADISGADLSEANLSGADLSSADLSSANLSGANLSRADLRDAVLTDATISDTSFDGAYYNGHTRWPQGFDPRAAGALEKP